MDDLEARGLLLAEVPYEHNYPFCWRCDTPLLYYAKTTWYVRTTALKDELLAANEEVTWYPEHIKHGRFGKWLENNIDWSLSRDRYWGTPLPVWRCDEGHDTASAASPSWASWPSTPPPDDLELHRPYVDEVVLRCPECGAEMRRVPEVIDAWFDSGSMPFAQWHYPFENEEIFRERFPADFICEAIDQTRGWFYSLLAIGTLLDRPQLLRDVLCLGHILDAEGQKMTKSLGNVVDPDDVLDRQGADALRWYLFTTSSPWFPRRFSAEMVDEVIRKFLLTLWNTYSFFTLYANIDGFDPAAEPVPVAERPLLDRWIVGRADRLVDERHRRPRGLRRHRHRPRHPGVRRRALQLVRAPQPAALLEERPRPRQARRLPHAVRVPGDAGQAARALHAVPRRGALPEPGALGRPGARRRACICATGRSPTRPPSTRTWPSAWPSRARWSSWAARRATRRRQDAPAAGRGGGGGGRRDERAALERLRDVVVDELNVKGLRLVASADELLDYSLKPNLHAARAAPRHGRSQPSGRLCAESTRPSSSPRCAPAARRRSCSPTASRSARRGRPAGRDGGARGLPR